MDGAEDFLGNPVIELHVPRVEALLAELPTLLTVGALVDVLSEAHFETPTFSAYLTPGGGVTPSCRFRLLPRSG